MNRPPKLINEWMLELLKTEDRNILSSTISIVGAFASSPQMSKFLINTDYANTSSSFAVLFSLCEILDNVYVTDKKIIPILETIANFIKHFSKSVKEGFLREPLIVRILKKLSLTTEGLQNDLVRRIYSIGPNRSGIGDVSRN